MSVDRIMMEEEDQKASVSSLYARQGVDLVPSSSHIENNDDTGAVFR